MLHCACEWGARASQQVVRILSVGSVFLPSREFEFSSFGGKTRGGQNAR